MRMSLENAELWFLGAADRLMGELEHAERVSLAEGLTEATFYSSGTFSTNALRKMYNPRGPYSRRDPHPPDDPGVINVQTGVFLEGWDGRGPTRTQDGLATQIRNDTRVADFMEGTALMMRRPVKDRIEDAIRQPREARIRKAIKDTFK